MVKANHATTRDADRPMAVYGALGIELFLAGDIETDGETHPVNVNGHPRLMAFFAGHLP